MENNFQFDIRKWSVSYYQEKKKKWVNGCLSCSPFAIAFASCESVKRGDVHQPADCPEIATDCHLVIEFSKIKKIQKATSLVVFPAITVETDNGVIHWFSSLPDRYSVYNMLQHFLTHSLTEGVKREAPKSTHQSRIGQALLKSAEDSEATLAAAATDLHQQGRQLDRTSLTLQEMHEDLRVAERLVSGLNTYLGQWKLPTCYQPLELVHIDKGATAYG
jgi:synaptosomal-associated protein 47